MINSIEISTQSKNLFRAVKRYARAFKNRSKFNNDGSVVIPDLEKFETLVYEEYSLVCARLEDDLDPKDVPAAIVELRKQCLLLVEGRHPLFIDRLRNLFATDYII